MPLLKYRERLGKVPESAASTRGGAAQLIIRADAKRRMDPKTRNPARTEYGGHRRPQAAGGN